MTNILSNPKKVISIVALAANIYAADSTKLNEILDFAERFNGIKPKGNFIGTTHDPNWDNYIIPRVKTK